MSVVIATAYMDEAERFDWLAAMDDGRVIATGSPRNGWAKLFGRPMAANDIETRRNVGYTSQSFSLYSELTVRQNLDLHAQLYYLRASELS